MAEALLQEFDQSIEVYSACLYPDQSTDPMAVQVMKEVGIDISMKIPKSYMDLAGLSLDYLITLCCGKELKSDLIDIPARHKIHLGFEDPRKASGTGEQLIELYRDVRDEIRDELRYFYIHVLSPELKAAN